MGLAQTDGFGAHDLVRHGVFEHTVLVNAGLVSEGIGTHDGLVGLHHDPGDQADQATAGMDVFGIDARLKTQVIVAGVQCHHHFLHGGIAGPLTDAVDGDFDLTGAGLNCRQGVGRGQTQVVMAVNAENGRSILGVCLLIY